jgi:hypothetical protein
MSFILSPAAGGGTISMTAASAISAGQPVIVNTSGQAEQVGTTGTGTALTVANNIGGPGAAFTGMAYMPQQSCYIVVGTTTVAAATYGTVGFTAGTPVTYSAVASGSYWVTVLPGSSTFVIFYRAPTTNYPTIVAGTISGTTVTLGTPVTIATYSLATSPVFPAAAVDSTRFILCYATVNVDGNCNSAAGSVSGTTITMGSVTATPDPLGDFATRPKAIWDSGKSRAVFLWESTGLGYVAATLSGTTLSYGTASNVSGYTGTFLNPNSILSYDTQRQQIIAYTRLAVGRGLLALVTTGTVVSQSHVLQDAGYTSCFTCYDSTANLIIASFNSDVRTVTNSGSAFTYNASTGAALNSGAVPVYDSTLNQTVGQGGSTVGIAKVGASNLGTGNYVGIAQNAASGSGTVTVNVIGSVASISGLTAGSNYGVLSIGGLAPVTSLTLGQYAGIATTNATLLLKG